MSFQNPSSEKPPIHPSLQDSTEIPIQQDTPPSHTKPSLFSHLTSYFHSSTPPPQPLKERDISVQQRAQTTLEQAMTIANNLSRLKEHLIAEFGDSSHSFISRSIDPMICHATQLAGDIGSTTNSPELGNLLDTAVESVSLYTQFSSEKRLKRKIIQEAVHATHQAIIKDCEILQNYKAHLLQDEVLLTTEQDTIESLISHKLEPIFKEFSQLLKSEFLSEDLRELFLWKTHIDTQRGALTELGLITIDSVLHHATHIHTENPIEEFLRQATPIEEIEEKAYNLLQLLENEDNFNSQVFDEISNLLTDIQNEVTVIEPTISEEFQHVLESAHRTIQQLEKQLEKKRFQERS